MDDSGRIAFVHLSDIHFRRGTADGRSVEDDDIRNEVLRDLARLSLKNACGVLVSGDVAFSGAKEEYAIAREWLVKVTETVGLQPEEVWVIPGNHDVDRSATKNSPMLMDVHRTIRTAPVGDIDAMISKYLLEEKLNPDLMFTPLKNYLEFASVYSCNHKPNEPIWADDVTLNDGSTLRLVGLNSTLVSNENDDDGANKVVLGQAQLQFPRIAGVEYLVMCHHPPQWLRDQDVVQDKLRERARVQLFGHKHTQRCEEIDRKSIKLSAGAMHPDQREPDWNPIFNIIEVGVTGTDHDRFLNVKVQPRAWKKSDLCFGPDSGLDGGAREFRLKLDYWEAPSNAVDSRHKPNPEPAKAARPAESAQLDRIPMNARRLTYQFLTLPYTKQIEVAQKVGLLEADDKGIGDQELFQRFFSRARSSGKINVLEDEIRKAHTA